VDEIASRSRFAIRRSGADRVRFGFLQFLVAAARSRVPLSGFAGLDAALAAHRPRCREFRLSGDIGGAKGAKNRSFWPGMFFYNTKRRSDKSKQPARWNLYKLLNLLYNI
jgi:hypothetical protein